MKRPWLLLGSLGLGLLLAGCISAEKAAEKGLLEDDFCKDAVPMENGTYVRQWNAAQIVEGKQDLLLISEHEWYNNGAALGPEGHRHATSIAEALLQGAECAVIEAAEVHIPQGETLEDATTATDLLNEQRRQHLVAYLMAQGIADADLRVMVAPQDRVGIRGVEAPRVYNNLLRGGNRQGGMQGQGGFGNNGMGGGFGGGFGGGTGGGFF